MYGSLSMRVALRMLEHAASLKQTPFARGIHLPPLQTHPRLPAHRQRGYFRIKAGEVRTVEFSVLFEGSVLQLEQEGVVLRNNYSAERNEAYWDRRPVVTTARLMQIGSVFGVWFVRSFVDGDQEAAASRLRGVLTSLGPAFVKIGQVASSRPDVVPPMYLRELEKLQDRIPPFSNEDAFNSMVGFMQSLRDAV